MCLTSAHTRVRSNRTAAFGRGDMGAASPGENACKKRQRPSVKLGTQRHADGRSWRHRKDFLEDVGFLDFRPWGYRTDRTNLYGLNIPTKWITEVSQGIGTRRAVSSRV